MTCENIQLSVQCFLLSIAVLARLEAVPSSSWWLRYVPVILQKQILPCNKTISCSLKKLPSSDVRSSNFRPLLPVDTPCFKCIQVTYWLLSVPYFLAGPLLRNHFGQLKLTCYFRHVHLPISTRALVAAVRKLPQIYWNYNAIPKPSSISLLPYKELSYLSI